MAFIPIGAATNPIDAFAHEEAGGGGLEALVGPPLQLPELPEPPPSFVGIEESTGTMFVNGFRFDVRDSNSALLSEKELDKPPQQLPAGFRPIAPDEYKSYLDQIDDPSLGRLIKENFGIGVENLKLLSGRGLQFLDPALGTEELGQEIVDEAGVELDFAQPFQRQATDVPDADNPVGAAFDWFVANLAQQGPNIIESALVAIAGAITGTFVGGPVVGTAFGAVGALAAKSVGKEGIKRAVFAAAKKHAAGEALDEMETKLMREVSSAAAGIMVKQGKRQARIGGAATFSAAGNYAFGVADVTGEQAESGERDRETAALLAIPYALFETLPEFLGLGFLAKGVKGGRLRRGVKGVVGGSLAEGATETGQELLLLGENLETDADSPEGRNRLINSFFAGAGVGGTIGGAGALLRKNVDDGSTDLLDPEKTPGTEVVTATLLIEDLREDGDVIPPTPGTILPPPPGPGGVLPGPPAPQVLLGPPETLGTDPDDPQAGRGDQPIFVGPTSGQQIAPAAPGRWPAEPLITPPPAPTPISQAIGESTADTAAAEAFRAARAATPEGPQQIAAEQAIIAEQVAMQEAAAQEAAAETERLLLAEQAAAQEAAAQEATAQEAAAREAVTAQETELAYLSRLQQRRAQTDKPEEPTITFSAPIGDTGRTSTYTLTVAEALENSAQRIQALTDLRACLG